MPEDHLEDPLARVLGSTGYRPRDDAALYGLAAGILGHPIGGGELPSSDREPQDELEARLEDVGGRRLTKRRRGGRLGWLRGRCR
jgi:hypothetical protein